MTLCQCDQSKPHCSDQLFQLLDFHELTLPSLALAEQVAIADVSVIEYQRYKLPKQRRITAFKPAIHDATILIDWCKEQQCLIKVIQPDMLREGFELVRQKKLEVTDDVSIIEALGRPVKVTQGSYTNIKVCSKCRQPPVLYKQAEHSSLCLAVTMQHVCCYSALQVTKCCIPEYQSVTSGCRFTHTVLYAGDYSR